MFGTFGAESIKNELLLIARVLMVLLYVIFGWQKLTDYSGTFAYFSQEGVPLPSVAVLIAVIMELGVGIALILGFLTRPLSLLLALYTLATAIIGHHFWTMSGMERVEAEISFFKNVSIMAGLLLPYLTGPGRYSLESKIKLS
jgi:putative oxidoreductase